MATFYYTASDPKGAIQKGEMQAQNKEAVLKFLQNKELLILSLSEKKQKLLLGFGPFQKITPQDKITMVENLSTMIKAGVPLREALDILISDSESAKLKSILEEVKVSLEQGSTFSSALTRFSEEFSEVFRNLIKTGEESGRLAETLLYLAKAQKKDQELKNKVRAAMIYPAILLLGAALVIILLLTFVLPRLVQVFSDLNVPLPLPTRILLFLSHLFSQNKIVTIVILIAALGLFWYLFRLSWFRIFIFRLLFKFPFVKNTLKEIELARLCRTLSTLLSSGVSIINALELAASSATSAQFQGALRSSQEAVTKGVSLGNVFRRFPGLFPKLLVSMVDAGEKSGEIDRLLQELAEFYEEKVSTSLRNLTVLVEPILLLLVGFLIGGIALSIIIPIYQLFGSI